MTEIKAKVVEFELQNHPNADLLSLALIKETGWQCVVRTEDMKDKSLGIYIPIDGLVDTTKPEFKFLDKDGSGKPFRIKTIRLRQMLSQGLLIPAPENSAIEDDFTEALNVKRYEPTIPVQLSGDSIRTPEAFTKYTSIENVKNYPRLLVEGENVRVALKLHGTNARYGFINDGKVEGLTYIVGSHNTAKDKDGSNVYSQISRQYDIENKLKLIVDEIKPKYNFIAMGEIVGSKIQDLDYGCKAGERKLYLFDVVLDGQYQPLEFVQDVAAKLGIETVPVLYRGPYSFEKVMEFRDGKDLIGNHCREGVITTAEPESRDLRLGRRVLKFISDDYLLRKNATDSH